MRHLRALMSNVAHDLKAPVACIVADTTLLREASEIAGLSINGVFLSCSNSIYASATFMMMAINRSQDFVKSSLNMALVPSISPFSLLEALSFACDCVDLTQSGGIITLHPMPTSVCLYVASDRQWLVDNLMCMVSNATKYGPAGTRVDVHVKLVPHNEPLSSMTFSTRTNSWLGWGQCQTLRCDVPPEAVLCWVTPTAMRICCSLWKTQGWAYQKTEKPPYFRQCRYGSTLVRYYDTIQHFYTLHHITNSTLFNILCLFSCSATGPQLGWCWRGFIRVA